MAVLTIKHYVDLATSYVQRVSNSTNAYYMFVARPQQWTNASGAADDSANSAAYNAGFLGDVNTMEQSISNDLLYGKLITSTGVKNLIPRYNWTTNTVYYMYNQNDPNLFTAGTSNNIFYVVTDAYQVYKVLNNNNGAPSTIKPTLTSTSGTFSTGDGYLWKYMYTIDATSNAAFTTNAFIPVTTDSSVSFNAVPSTIDTAIITNGGTGYGVYESGYIQNLISAYSIQLPSTSSPSNDYYTKSSIYLKSGFGSGQLRQITGYNGFTKAATFTTPMNYYSLIEFTTLPTGVALGYSAVQPIDYVSYVYSQGYFNVGETVVQSETGAIGTIISANSSVLAVNRTSTASSFGYNSSNQWYPVMDTNNGGTLGTGTVSTLNNTVYANVISSSFVASSVYAVGNYIRVGNSISTNTNVRRIVAVNTSVVTADIPFVGTYSSNNHYLIPNAFEPSSVLIKSVSGTISNVNLNSVKLLINYPALAGVSYIVGETVNLINSANVYQGANGIVAYANSSALVLSTTGTWTTGLYAYGLSSQQVSYISTVTSNPSITVSSPTFSLGSSYIAGQKVFFYNATSTTSTGNGTIATATIYPNSLTEYLISPTVTITGDGTGARAYAVVNNAVGSGNNISQVIFLNPGTGYSTANIAITANNQYGSGAVVNAIISPTKGHGYDAITELGGRYCGVSMTFDTLANESYRFPYYGNFRMAGIIENPQYSDITVSMNSFDRVNLNFTGGSIFTPGEIVINAANATSNQYSNASGVCVFSNSSLLQLKNVQGTWVTTACTFNKAYGISSTSNVAFTTANVIYFTTGSGSEIVSETNSGASAKVVQTISDTVMKLTNVVGKFDTGDIIYDPLVNAYATVATISIANNTYAYGNVYARFSQLGRFTLNANTGVFQQYEYISQTGSNVFARIVSTNSDIDILYTAGTGTFANGQTIILTSSSTTNGVILSVNTTSGYIKLTNVYNPQNFISAASGSAISSGGVTGTINSTNPVLVLNGVTGNLVPTSIITGLTSSATGLCSNSLNITNPDLVYSSGTVTYLEAFAPATKSATSQEQVKLVIKF